MDVSRFLLGIDVSHFQGRIDWSKVAAAGYKYAFVKATDGVRFVDAQYAANVEAARQAGIIVGSYHFFRPAVSATQQVDHFLATANPQPGDLPPALDVEIQDGIEPEFLANGVTDWIDSFQAQTGIVPMIYTTAAFWNTRVKLMPPAGLPLWIAHYTEREPNIPAAWQAWTFWQHSQNGMVNGIPGHVDLNYFAGDEAALSALCIQPK